MTDEIEKLPAPTCPLPGGCPPGAKLERVVAHEQRPGEIDVAVRCMSCQGVCHYRLDEAHATDELAQTE